MNAVIVDMLEDIEEDLLDYYLRPDSAERVKCLRCGGDDFSKESITHKPNCLVGNIRASIDKLSHRDMPLPDPARMSWIDLRNALWERFKDDDREDDDLCVSRAEALSILGWADLFDRNAQPRRDEEERSFAIIRNAAERLNEVEREAFYAGCEAGIKNYGGGNIRANWDQQWEAFQVRHHVQPAEPPS